MTYKIRNPWFILLACFVIFSTWLSTAAWSQDSTNIKPAVTEKFKEYKKQVNADRTKKMIELRSFIPNLVYDLRYASTNNFTHRAMYPVNTTVTYMRLPAAIAIGEVMDELRPKGLGLKIFDAYRPYSVTVAFWELIKDERYVANPSKGSGHNKGIAIDLTIINLKTGQELNMGTGFDNFSDTAHQAFTYLPEEVLQNRAMLRTIMEKHGFKVLETEWWHYFLADGDKYEVLDISFKKFKN